MARFVIREFGTLGLIVIEPVGTFLTLGIFWWFRALGRDKIGSSD